MSFNLTDVFRTYQPPSYKKSMSNIIEKSIEVEQPTENLNNKIDNFNTIIETYENKRIKKKFRKKEMINGIGEYVQNNLIVEDEL